MKKNNLKACVFLFFLGIYILLMGGHLYSPDEEIMFRVTESIASFSGFAIEPLVKEGDRFTQRGTSGHFYGHYGLGQSLLAMPLYYFGKLASQMLPSYLNNVFRTNTIQYHNRSFEENIVRFTVSLFNSIITALTVLILYQFALTLGSNHKNALFLVFLYGISTIALPHAKTFFSEPLATLLILLSFYFLYKYQNSLKQSHLIFAGISLGYGIFTRLDTLITVPVFILYLTLIFFKIQSKDFNKNTQQKSVCQHLKGLIFKEFLFLLPVLLFCVLIGIYNYVRFGKVTSTGYESEGLRFNYPILDGLYGLLFSAGKGIFFYSPPIVLFFFAIKNFFEKYKAEAIFCILITISYLLTFACWESWAGGWCWGPRHVFQIHVFLIIPVISLLERFNYQPKKSILYLFLIFAVIGFFVQIPGILVSFMDYCYWLFEIQQIPNYFSLYIPIHSNLIGHWYLVNKDMIDLFWFRLLVSSLPFYWKVFILIPVGLILSTGYCIWSRIKNLNKFLN